MRRIVASAVVGVLGLASPACDGEKQTQPRPTEESPASTAAGSLAVSTCEDGPGAKGLFNLDRILKEINYPEIAGLPVLSERTFATEELTATVHNFTPNAFDGENLCHDLLEVEDLARRHIDIDYPPFMLQGDNTVLHYRLFPSAIREHHILLLAQGTPLPAGANPESTFVSQQIDDQTQVSFIRPGASPSEAERRLRAVDSGHDERERVALAELCRSQANVGLITADLPDGLDAATAVEAAHHGFCESLAIALEAAKLGLDYQGYRNLIVGLTINFTPTTGERMAIVVPGFREGDYRGFMD